MHLNASGRSRVNGNRPADPGKRAAEQGVQGAPQAGTRDGASQSRHRKLHPCNSRISLEFREVGLPRPRRWSSIWSFPEPPIEFLLVGTRRTAKYGKESRLRNADVAQLVEHHLAKVDVASSNLVVRSQDTVMALILRNRRLHGGLAERRGSGLQSRIHGFESRTHLGENHGFRLYRMQWAIGAAVARFPDTEEVTGSIPVSPTRARKLACS
jgi:hypothetical protein